VAPPNYFAPQFSASEVLSWTAHGGREEDPQTPPFVDASASAASAASADVAPHAAFPDTPAALARLAASPARRAAAAAARARAAAAFAVLHAPPRDAPPHAHVLAEFIPSAAGDEDEEAPATLFTMRTRVDARWAVFCAQTNNGFAR
jgi:hypothetical protein